MAYTHQLPLADGNTKEPFVNGSPTMPSHNTNTNTDTNRGQHQLTNNG
jgi:hypothetical protein